MFHLMSNVNHWLRSIMRPNFNVHIKESDHFFIKYLEDAPDYLHHHE